MGVNTRVLWTIWVDSTYKCQALAPTKSKYKTWITTLSPQLLSSTIKSLLQEKTRKHSCLALNTERINKLDWLTRWSLTHQVALVTSNRRHHLTHGRTWRTLLSLWSESRCSWVNLWRESTQTRWKRHKRINKMSWRTSHRPVNSNEKARRDLLTHKPFYSQFN